MDCHLYDEMWQLEQKHWWFVGRRRILGSLIEQYASPRNGQRLRVCELGCGTGGNIASWDKHYDVVGVDSSDHALAYARRRLGDRVVSGRLPDQVPLPRAHYDVVLLADVFEHIEADAAAAATALALVRPHGILIATVPAYQWLYSPRDAQHQHFRRYSKVGFEQLFRFPGVRLELLSCYNTLLFPLAAAARLWAKWRSRPEANGDLRVPISPINWLLERILTLEKHLLGKMLLPFGLSHIAVARKCDIG